MAIIETSGAPVSFAALGIIPDGVQLADGAITNAQTAFTSSSASFSSADVGKLIVVNGAGAAAGPLITTISAFVSPGAVTLAAAAGTTVVGATTRYGTDLAASILAAFNTAGKTGVNPSVLAPQGIYMVGSNVAPSVTPTIFGAGKGSTIFVKAFTGSSPAFTFSTTAQFVHRDFTIAGVETVRTQGGHGLRYNTCTGYTVESVEVYGVGCIGILHVTASQMVSRGCYVHSNMAGGIVTQGGSSGCTITGNVFSNTGDDAVAVNSYRSDTKSPTGSIASTDGTNTLTKVGGSGVFDATHVGDTITVAGAGAAGADLVTTVATFVDATHVTLTAGATTTVVAAKFWLNDMTATAGSTTITSLIGGFSAATDVDKIVCVAGAGPGGLALFGQIASVTNSSNAVLYAPAATTVANAGYFYGGYSYNVAVTGNSVTNGAHHGIACFGSVNVDISGNTINGTQDPCIQVNASSADPDLGADSVSIVGNTCRLSSRTTTNGAIYVLSAMTASPVNNVLVANNIIRDAGSQGIQVGANSAGTSNVKVIGNKIYNVGVVTSANGIGIFAVNTVGLTVQGNDIDTCTREGISVATTVSGPCSCQGNTLSNLNTSATASKNGVLWSAHAAGGIVDNNVVVDASANLTAAFAVNSMTGMIFGSNHDASARGIVGAASAPVAFASATVASSAPGGPTTTTLVMMGLAGAITPSRSGRVLITILGNCQNGTIGDGIEMVIKTGTGAAPANQAAVTGTSQGSTVDFVASTVAGKVPFTLQALVTNLIPGTAYWFDFAARQLTGGTVTFANVSALAVEA